jgi:hypothetical protein
MDEALVAAIKKAKARVVACARAHGRGLVDDETWADTAAAVIRDVHCVAGLLGGGADPDDPTADFADGPSRARVEAAIDLTIRQCGSGVGQVLDAVDAAADTFDMEACRRKGQADFDGPTGATINAIANDMIRRNCPGSKVRFPT